MNLFGMFTTISAWLREGAEGTHIHNVQFITKVEDARTGSDEVIGIREGGDEVWEGKFIPWTALRFNNILSSKSASEASDVSYLRACVPDSLHLKLNEGR